jgi:hypothetical protein
MPETKTTTGAEQGRSTTGADQGRSITGADQGRSITDVELVSKIKTSHLDERQKIELKPLIPDMTAEERRKLLDLIEQSNANKIEKLSEKPETDDAKVEDLTATEETETIAEKPKETARTELGKAKKHTLRNVMLIVFLLILIAAGILLIINYL